MVRTIKLYYDDFSYKSRNGNYRVWDRDATFKTLRQKFKIKDKIIFVLEEPR